jgi:hypothetical protein
LGAPVFFAGEIFQGLWFAVDRVVPGGFGTRFVCGMRVRHVLEHVEAGEVMEPDPVRGPAGATIADAVHDYLLRHDHDAFGIEDAGRLVGAVTLERVRQVPRGLEQAPYRGRYDAGHG